MKKLLGFLLILFFGSLTLACQPAVTTENPLRLEGRTVLLELTQRFGRPEYVDDFYEDSVGSTSGYSDVVLYASGDSVVVILIQSGVTAIVEVVMSESGSLRILVWNVMFTYINEEKEIYVYLDYYHYDELFREDFADEDVDITFTRFVELMDSLTISDVEWVIAELGYDVIQQSTEGGSNI